MVEAGMVLCAHVDDPLGHVQVLGSLQRVAQRRAELLCARFAFLEGFRNRVLQASPIKAKDGRLRTDAAGGEAAYWWIWPNLMLNVYPDNFSTNLIVPLDEERTLTVFEWFFRETGRPGVAAKVEETVAFSDEIQIEDIAICEAVQRGLRSRTYLRGRYSEKRESGVHRFHRLWTSAMETPAVPER